MFIPVWLTFVVTGIAMALGVVVWAVRTGQLEDSHRARYLPLGDLTAAELASRPPVRRGAGFYANLAVFMIGLVALGVTLALVIEYAG